MCDIYNFDLYNILQTNETNKNNSHFLIKSKEEINDEEITDFFNDEDIKTFLHHKSIFSHDKFDEFDNEQFDKFLIKIKEKNISEDDLSNFLNDDKPEEIKKFMKILNNNNLNIIDVLHVIFEETYDHIFYENNIKKEISQEIIYDEYKNTKTYSIVGDVTPYTKILTEIFKKAGIDYIFINKVMFTTEELDDIDYDFDNDFSIYFDQNKIKLYDIVFDNKN